MITLNALIRQTRPGPSRLAGLNQNPVRRERETLRSSGKQKRGDCGHHRCGYWTAALANGQLRMAPDGSGWRPAQVERRGSEARHELVTRLSLA